MPCSQIQRVVEQLPAVGAGVDDDGQHRSGVNARRSGVHHQLAYGDINAVRSPVSDAEDAFRIGDHDQSNMPIARRIPQRRLDILGMLHIKVCRVLRLHVQMTVVLDGLGDFGIVDDGIELVEVMGEQIIEQGAVRIEDFHKEQTFLQIRPFRLKLEIRLLLLLLNRLHVRWKYAYKTHFFALFKRKGGALVHEWVI